LVKEPILVEFSSNENNSLILLVKLPLSEIPILLGSNNFSIGIETGTMSMSGMSGGQAPASGLKSRSRQGGGMRGGSMGGRGSGGGMRGGGQRPASGGGSSSMSPISLWFQVQL
jgi:hypothetical protein